ncbi:hypothetical protein BDE36_1121 [Arcticibacter tournemirensis]|uniref:Helix-turn-helix domain-containing protein n=1 Tax=Arcticibacter tournemirensis TaxID=699437 RepID=A0A5M9H4Z5_9SPHI|nr:helix-turn-helix domain-containing protein [Arcticibacter tournemirensis]KAA8482012.1 helix-turn-helix domain-containing protein [Arcticibacter tournemirensis]TQM49416.1 hypothetical protein BDE36_1121 [Arcticibacter tournemirensis]
MREIVRLTKNVFNLVEILGDIRAIMQEMNQCQKEMQSDFQALIKSDEKETYLTAKQVAILLSVDVKTVRNWKLSGELEPDTIRGRKLYARSKVLKYGHTRFGR